MAECFAQQPGSRASTCGLSAGGGVRVRSLQHGSLVTMVALLWRSASSLCHHGGHPPTQPPSRPATHRLTHPDVHPTPPTHPRTFESTGQYVWYCGLPEQSHSCSLMRSTPTVRDTSWILCMLRRAQARGMHCGKQVRSTQCASLADAVTQR